MAMSQDPNATNREHRRRSAVRTLGPTLPVITIMALVTLGFIAWAPRPHTTTVIPARCQTAATTTSAHLRALTGDSGTRIAVTTIRHDITELASCR